MSDKIIKVTYCGYECTLETIDPVTLRYCNNDLLHTDKFSIGPEENHTDEAVKKILNHLRVSPKEEWNKFALLNIGNPQDLSKQICKAVLAEKLIVVKY